MTLDSIIMTVVITGIVCVGVYFIERWFDDDNNW